MCKGGVDTEGYPILANKFVHYKCKFKGQKNIGSNHRKASSTWPFHTFAGQALFYVKTKLPKWFLRTMTQRNEQHSTTSQLS